MERFYGIYRAGLNRLPAWVLCLLALLAAQQSRAQIQQTPQLPYSFVDIGEVTQLGGLNNSTDPVIACQRQVGTTFRAFVWWRNQFYLLTSGSPSTALAVNNNHDVYGMDAGNPAR